VEDYTLLAFGGAGPTHVAGYTKGTNYKDVMMFPYSSVFCAFGVATADFSHQFIHATHAYLPYKASDELKVTVGKIITDIWEKLKAHAYEQMLAEGFSKGEVLFDHIAFVRYMGQLDEIMVHSPVPGIKKPSDMDKFIQAFEDEYSRIYTAAAKYPEAGYLSRHVGLIAYARKPKPKLIREKRGSRKPPESALKGRRDAFFGDRMVKSDIYELSELKPGNVIYGPAIIEHVNTNYVIPPDRHVDLDEYRTLWLKRGGK
jgi:N-methylhydantoinase A